MITLTKLTETFCFNYLETKSTILTPRIKPNTGSKIKVAIPIGISFGAVSLIIIAIFGFFIYKKNTNGAHAVENADGTENEPNVNRNPDGEDDQAAAVGAAAAAEVRLLSPETSSDLNTRKETGEELPDFA